MKYYLSIVCNPLFSWGVKPPTKLKKRRSLKRSQILEGAAAEEGITFFTVLQFLHKNKLKSEKFNDKKILQRKTFFSIIAENSIWKILTKNFVTFKR